MLLYDLNYLLRSPMVTQGLSASTYECCGDAVWIYSMRVVGSEIRLPDSLCFFSVPHVLRNEKKKLPYRFLTLNR